MKFEVILLPQAEADLLETLNWLQSKTKRGALNWLEAWNNAVSWLSDFGDSCGQAPEGKHFDHVIQQHFFRTRLGNPYRVLFTIRKDQLFVIHVRGFGRELVDDLDLTGL